MQSTLNGLSCFIQFFSRLIGIKSRREKRNRMHDVVVVMTMKHVFFSSFNVNKQKIVHTRSGYKRIKTFLGRNGTDSTK